MNVNEYYVPEERFDPAKEFPHLPEEYPALEVKPAPKHSTVVRVLAFSSALILASGSIAGIGYGQSGSSDAVPTETPVVTAAPAETASTAPLFSMAPEGE